MNPETKQIEAATVALWVAMNLGVKGAALTPYKLAVIRAEREAGLRPN